MFALWFHEAIGSRLQETEERCSEHYLDKGKGRGKGPPAPKAKEGLKGGGKTGGGEGGGSTGSTTRGQQGQAKGKPQAKKRSQSQPKSKAKAKHSAQQVETGFASLSWGEEDLYDSSSSSVAGPSAPFAGCVSLDNFAHACSFYTTFNPAFLPSLCVIKAPPAPPYPRYRCNTLFFALALALSRTS